MGYAKAKAERAPWENHDSDLLQERADDAGVRTPEPHLWEIYRFTSPLKSRKIEQVTKRDLFREPWAFETKARSEGPDPTEQQGEERAGLQQGCPKWSYSSCSQGLRSLLAAQPDSYLPSPLLFPLWLSLCSLLLTLRKGLVILTLWDINLLFE